MAEKITLNKEIQYNNSMKVYFNDMEAVHFVAQINELTESTFNDVIDKLINKLNWLNKDEFIGLKLSDGNVGEEFDDWYELVIDKLGLTGNFIIADDNVSVEQMDSEWEEAFG